MFYCLKLGASANKAMNCRPVLPTLCFEMLVCSVGCIGKRAKALHKWLFRLNSCIVFAKIHMKARCCLLRVFEDVVLPICTLCTEFVGQALQFRKMRMALVVWSVGRCRIACISVGSENGSLNVPRWSRPGCNIQRLQKCKSLSTSAEALQPENQFMHGFFSM